MYIVVIGALLIGLTLGLMGSGGSILTVPVLVYLLGHDDKTAIAESLGIVGTIALFGAVPYMRSREVDWRNVLYFGLPGMAGTYGGAWLSQYVAGAVQLTLFALVMLLAAWMMFRRPTARTTIDESEQAARPPLAWVIALEGLCVGVVTGLVGVGGGFLIVPALVLFGNLPVRSAVATSLPIVAANSLSGFVKHLAVLSGRHVAIDWTTMSVFVLLGIIGALAGNLVGLRINQRSLHRAFAVFLVVMAVFVLAKEGPRVFTTATTPTTTAATLSVVEPRSTANEPAPPAVRITLPSLNRSPAVRNTVIEPLDHSHSKPDAP